ARQLLLPLDHVDGDTDRTRVVRNRALHRLTDPPGRVRRELVAPAPVDLLDGAVQPERPLLDQVEERDAEPAVALCDRDDKSEIRLDHVTLGSRVAALDPLREHDLLGRGEQLVTPDVGEEELQAVGRAGDRHGGDRGLGGRLFLFFLYFRLRRLGRLSVRRLRRGMADLEPGALSLAGELLDLVVVELELGCKGRDLRGIDEPALLGALDHGADLVRLEQIVELVLRQRSLSPFVLLRRFSASLRTLGGKSSGYHPRPGVPLSDTRRTLERAARQMYSAPRPGP